jgi:2-polyprenyl-6-methoxyphenol hydroxylase-like FAD-dependent oxidoreductase
MTTYDIVTIGGGLGGAALAKAMAERGSRVLVVEREREFRDRVRGEALAPWGVAEAKALGLFDTLADRHGNELTHWRIYAGGQPLTERPFRETTPQKTGWITFYHPSMQELVLDAAEKAGAEVRRGARVVDVKPGARPRVVVDQGGKTEEIEARIVVAADGRGSAARRMAGFESRSDPPKILFAGVLLENLRVDVDRFHHFVNPTIGRMAYLFPQRDGRARSYVGCHKDTLEKRLQGDGGFERYVDEAERTGVPRALFREARIAGPLAMFDGADSWVPHPFKDGVALLGDAAATSDPTWGQGMSTTLRAARVLRDRLSETEDWHAAGHAYAEEHDRTYETVHRADGWFADLFMEIGAEAEERRARALPLLAGDPMRMVDVPSSGPESRCDEAARRRFFGED